MSLAESGAPKVEIGVGKNGDMRTRVFRFPAIFLTGDKRLIYDEVLGALSTDRKLAAAQASSAERSPRDRTQAELTLILADDSDWVMSAVMEHDQDVSPAAAEAIKLAKGIHPNRSTFALAAVTLALHNQNPDAGFIQPDES